MMVGLDGIVRVYSVSGAWMLDYRPGARLADIRYLGHVVDCVQVREWDFSLNEQVSRVPDSFELESVLQNWVDDRDGERP
jgi:hypothetical protein